MKVFWSWQSDTPGNIGRHFIKGCISEALQKIRNDIGVEEPAGGASREGLHLDQDRQGVAGSPELFRTILEKIEQSFVVIADVTSVGTVTSVDGKNKGKSAKKLINHNVGIEIGYALKAHGDSGLLMVMNEHFGTREDLPFDLRAKAGPIIFNLPPNATGDEIKTQSKILTTRLVEAIGLCLKNAVIAEIKAKPKAAFPRAAHAKTSLAPAQFYQSGEVIANFGRPGEQEYRIDQNPLFYLRFHPEYDGQKVGNTKLKEIFMGRKVVPLSLAGRGEPARNNYGYVVIDPLTGKAAKALTQGFDTGELWGVNSKLTNLYRPQGMYFGDVPTEFNVITPVTVEHVYVDTLTNYFRVSQQAMNLVGPFHVEIGAVGLKKTRISLQMEEFSEECFDNKFEFHGVINSEEEIMPLLGEAFKELFDKYALDRDKVYTDKIIAAHNLPPKSKK